MDVITMLSTTSLLLRLKNNYPQFIFKPGNDFSWSSRDNTIYYKNDIDNDIAFLFHELSHAILGHTDYEQDIQLITMERQAWEHAVNLASVYDVSISDETVQTTIDSYRDWLHLRSCCPKCTATGMQFEKNSYACPACSHKWLVNEARLRALRRYELK
jgi:DNA-directed RNA polymerase subunit RPC12/RpoP